MRQRWTMWVALMMCWLAIAARADVFVNEDAVANHYITVETNVAAGTASLVYTNNQERPFSIVSIATYDEGNYTNTFTVDLISRDWTRQYVGNVVETNDWGLVETNYYPTVTNISYAYYTNNIVTNLATNLHSEVYAVNKSGGWLIPEWHYVQIGDAVKFTWTYTTDSRRLRFTAIR